MTNPVRTSAAKGVPMDSLRKSALAVGVLFILTFVTSIGAVIAYGPVLSDPNYITGAGADTRVLFGAFLELFLIITNIGCAVVLFPLLKRVRTKASPSATSPLGSSSAPSSSSASSACLRS